MPDFLDKINNLIISAEEDRPLNAEGDHQLLLSRPQKKAPTLNPAPLPKREDFTYAQRRSESNNSTVAAMPPESPALKEPLMSKNPRDMDEKINALKRLRELPRGSHVDSRIAAIESLLGEVEIYKSLKMLRWPQGVICPRCRSTNVVRRDPPPNAVDQRHFYICLNCKGDGNPCDFDDLTGLPIDSLQSLRQWIFCWYLIGFCSVAQIAKVLGISLSEVLQIANYGSELAELPEELVLGSGKTLELSQKKSREAARKAQITTDEENTRSASKSPLKPGYKSKK